MKRIDWLIAFALVLIGFSCLTMSAAFMMSPSSITDYLSVLVKICLWTGFPVLVVGIVYLIFKEKKT